MGTISNGGITPAEYTKIGLMPGYGPVSEEGTQYIQLVVSQNDGMGAMSSVRLFLYDEKKELQLISQIYYQCAQEHNKCFIEFNIKPSQLKNLEVELYYLSEGESPKIREYRVQGLGMLTSDCGVKTRNH